MRGVYSSYVQVPSMKELMIYYPHTQTTTKTWQNGSQSFILQLSYNGKNGTTPRALQLLYHLLHLSHAISTQTQTHKHEGRKVTIECSPMVVALYLDYSSYYGITCIQTNIKTS